MTLKRSWFLQVLSLEYKVSTCELRLGAWRRRSIWEGQKRKLRWWRVISTNDLNWSFNGKRCVWFFSEVSWNKLCFIWATLSKSILSSSSSPPPPSSSSSLRDCDWWFWAYPNLKEQHTSVFSCESAIPSSPNIAFIEKNNPVFGS